MPTRLTLEGKEYVYLRKPQCFDCASFIQSPPLMDSCYVRRGAQGKKGWWVVGYRCAYCRKYIDWIRWYNHFNEGFNMYSFYYGRPFKFMEKEQYKLLLNEIRKVYGFPEI